MDLSQLPSFVATKLAQLSDARAAAAVRAGEVDRSIAELRERLLGRVQRAGDTSVALSSQINALLAEQKTLAVQRPVDDAILQSCRSWIAALPDGATLTPVAVTAAGHDLVGVRKRIKAANVERAALQNAPVPSPDIETRVRDDIRQQARPKLRGIGVGEQLSTVWPDPTRIFARLHEKEMVAWAMEEVERMASDPLPMAERGPRIAALDRELDELRRLEDAIVTATGAPRSRGTLPEVVLCARVARAPVPKAA